MSAARHVAFLVGLVLLVVLLSFLPEDVFGAAQALLLITAGAILFLFAASVVFTPARRVLARLFGYAPPKAGPALRVLSGDEWRELMQPLFTALVLLAAAGLPTIVRALV